MASTFRALAAGLSLTLFLLPGAAARAASLEDLKDSAADARRFPTELTADALEYEAAREVYVARGNVVIRQGPRTLKADWIAFNPETGAGVASGNVELVQDGETLRADFVEFNTRNLEGAIRAGELDSPGSQFRTSGALIEKTGERTYRFEDGVFTTCRCPDADAAEPWRIRAEEAELEIEGYGTVRNARFEVLGVPVLWLPWMIYPIKTERQSGFLFPDLSFASRDGFGVGLPYFWAVRDEINATLTPSYTVRRGFKGDLDLEYVFGAESRGELSGAYAHDLDIDPNTLSEPYGRDRWAATGSQDWILPADVRLQADFEFASDNDYALDFDDLSAHRADRYLESTASLSRLFGGTGRFSAAASVLFADDLQNPDDLDRDDTLLQRMPQVRLAMLPGSVPGIPWLQPSVDFEYVHFAAIDRARGGSGGFLDTGVDGVIDADERGTGHGDDFIADGGTEGDGSFQEGEPLTDDGHRFVVQPRVAAPFRVGRFLEVYPEVGWHQTLYHTREQGQESRGLLNGRVDLRSRLARRYDTGLVHVVEPLLGYAYVGPESQSGSPLFVPGTALPQERVRVLDLGNVTRDPADRIGRANRFRFGVAQRLSQSAAGEGAARGFLADLTLLGSYDLEESEFGAVVLDGRVAPPRLGSLRFHLGYDPNDTEIDEALADWRWVHAAGHELGLGYRFLRDLPDVFEDFGTGDRFDDVKTASKVDQARGDLRLILTSSWSLSYRIAYSFAPDLLLANEGVLEYLSKCGCWSIGVEVSDDRARGLEVKLLYRLIGLGNDRKRNPVGLLDALGGV